MYRKGGDLEKSLPNHKQKEETNMPIDEFGYEIDTEDAMDETFNLLAMDLELDEDDLRANEELTKQVKDFVLDTGTTWDDLVATCDEAFGSSDERLDNLDEN